MVRQSDSKQSKQSEKYTFDWDSKIPAESDSRSDPFGEIMDRLDQLLASLGRDSQNKRAKQANPSEYPEDLIRRPRTPLPDPRLVRSLIRCRQMRMRFFNSELFADPAWDMLLDLTAARGEHRRVSITSLCLASGVPTTTALRWIKLLEQAGAVERIEDDTDRRRAFVALSEHGAEAMAQCFEGFRGQMAKYG